MLNTFFVEQDAFTLEARKKTLSQFFKIKLFFKKYYIFPVLGKITLIEEIRLSFSEKCVVENKDCQSPNYTGRKL